MLYPKIPNTGRIKCEYQEIVDSVLESTSVVSEGIISNSFNLLLERKKELIDLYGGKGYNILLLIELSKELGFKVPHTRLISTDFYKESLNLGEDNDGLEKLAHFEGFLNEMERFSSIKDYFKENVSTLKILLKNLTLEDLNGKYSILLELYCDILGCEFSLTKQDNKCIQFYSIGEDGKGYETKGMRIGDLLQDLKREILLSFGFIQPKSYEELINKSNYGKLTHKGAPEKEKVDDYLESVAYGYVKENDLNQQTDNFLGKITKISFSDEQEKFLKEIYNRFSGSKFVSVRSSANVEDGEKYNYPGVFYTGFCPTNNFALFKSEVIKVLESGRGYDLDVYQRENGLNDDVFMGIVVMEVVGDEYSDMLFDSPYFDYNLGGHFLDSIKEDGNPGKLFYPDGGGVLSIDDLGDDSFVRILGVKGLPTTITGNSNQAISADIEVGTGKILGYENQPGGYLYYKQTGVAGLNLVGQINYHLDVIKETDRVLRTNIKTSPCYNENETYDKNSRGCSFLPFSLEQYKKLAEIYPLLEGKYGYPVELEFIVHNGVLHIIQARKSISNFIKPDNLIKPSEILIDNFLPKQEILSSYGYINNEDLDLHKISNWGSGYIGKSEREEYVLDKIKSLEENSTGGYIVVFNIMTDFPLINKSDFPNLKLIITKGNKGLGTHAIMRIREFGIPMIFLDDKSNFMNDIQEGKYKSFIDGNRDALVYKSK